MNQLSRSFALSAVAMAASLLVTACGGGDAEAPPKASTGTATTTAADTVPPTFTISDNVAGTTASGDITFTFTFSEDVGISFTADDVVVTGGTKGAFLRVGTTQATLVVTPTANSAGTVGLNIGAGMVKDLAGNGNATAVAASRAYNTVIPVITTKLVSFQETIAPTLIGFGNADGTVVADPTDATNKVAKVIKAANAELWAGVTAAVCPGDSIATIPFSAANKKMSVRVFSPDAGIPVRLKVENAADGSKSVETEATVTTAAGWQTLTFDFNAPAAGTAALNLANTYNKASIFFNFGKTGAQVGAAKTYYFDDVSFVGSSFTAACPSAGGGGGGTNTTISFDEATPPVFTGFGGADGAIVADPANAANKVAKTVKAADAELWAGTTVSNLANQAIAPIGFSATNKVITVRVWAPEAGIPVRLKVENAADGTKTAETEATTTVAGGWQTLSFNFGSVAAGTAALDLAQTFNKASIFFNFGKTGAQSGGAKTYYFDDIVYPAAAASSGGGTGGGTAGTLVGGVYAGEYTGDLDPAKNLPPKTTAGGDVGFFYDARLANNKYYDFGGISGPVQNPGGVNNFYYGLGLKPPAITDAYFGAYVNAPNNGTTNVSAYTNLTATLWGPAELFEKSFTPAIQVVMAGPAVAGCASNSGRSEVQRIIAAAQKIGAASNYVLPLSSFTLKFACSGETTVAQVLAKIAQINFTLVGTNVQYSVPDTSNPPAYANGLNIGPIKFN